MYPAPESSSFDKVLEILGYLLPFIYIFIGYLLGRLDKKLEEKKRIKNLKTILFFEVSFNYFILRNMIKMKDNEKSTLEKAYISGRLSSSIFNSYFDRFDLLERELVAVLMHTYMDLEHTDEIRERLYKYNIIPEGKTEEDMDEELAVRFQEAFNDHIISLHKSMFTAFIFLRKGNEDIADRLIKNWQSEEKDEQKTED